MTPKTDAPVRALPVNRSAGRPHKGLELDWELVEEFLVNFLRDEVTGRKGFEKGIVALSGGVDSAVTAYLAVRAFGPENVVALRLPYRSSNPDSLAHAQLVVEALGIHSETIDITGAVDGYAENVAGMTAHRKGNLMARVRMMITFDKSEEFGALPLGTGNKT
ncbi:MAG TPA: NAD(+) synthase, partial [Trueperaceae bacterium]